MASSVYCRAPDQKLLALPSLTNRIWKNPEGNCTGNVYMKCWKLLKGGWFRDPKISSRFLWIFYFYENLDKKRPYFMYDGKKKKKSNVFRWRRQFHVKCIPWHLAKTFAAFKHTAAVRNWFSHLSHSKKVLRWSLFIKQNLKCGQIWDSRAVYSSLILCTFLKLF